MHVSVNKDSQVHHLLKCHYENILGPYLDESLKAKDQQKMENHLKVCDSCANKALALKKANDFIKESIPRTKISQTSLELIENEVTELIELNERMTLGPIAKKSVFKDIFSSLFSVQSLRMYALVLTVIYMIRVIQS